MLAFTVLIAVKIVRTAWIKDLFEDETSKV